MDLLGALAQARALGFLGPGPTDAHLAHAAAFAEAIGPFDGLALDLGSGGGVPGLVLAAQYPGSRWILLDKNRRRTSFLSHAVASLGWSARVSVVRAAAELAGHDRGLRQQCALVVARSFGPPPVTAECGSAFLGLGGRLMVSEPPDDVGTRWDAHGLRDVGLDGVPMVSAGNPRVATFTKTAPLSAHYPRLWKHMMRTPLW